MPLLRWHNELSHQNLSRRYDFAELSKLIVLVTEPSKLIFLVQAQ